ncbi:hypothetical protein B0T24DRAFT_526806 [Lasiosphaeria ovina]|uniref:Fe2OG dioxygenase domain-containing protein n=1 Tax=Lasiosphaeria ovina TaxID=92902 RepID=A0AAE0KHC5_9PEZI|nr:hypothetical protein B0T24DRAFT_526806 [Lasiosphaeria ovina]
MSASRLTSSGPWEASRWLARSQSSPLPHCGPAPPSPIVATWLGISVPVSAELYKMLIYEMGAMFNPHTDTEKIPGMFGALVVYLPSPHQGGDLVLRHRGQTKVFKSQRSSRPLLAGTLTCPHEVLPVTSGCRWVLTYNLAISPELETRFLRAETRNLRHALQKRLRQVQHTPGPHGPQPCLLPA